MISLTTARPTTSQSAVFRPPDVIPVIRPDPPIQQKSKQVSVINSNLSAKMAATSASTPGRSTPTVPPPQPPAPASLDILPALLLLISRLDTAPTPIDPNPHNPSRPDLPAPGPIPTKDLPTMTDNVKSQLQKARRQILQLPDMDVSVAEQEAELRELDAKIEAQKRMLESLRDSLARK